MMIVQGRVVTRRCVGIRGSCDVLYSVLLCCALFCVLHSVLCEGTCEGARVILNGLLLQPHVLQQITDASHDVQRLEVRQTLGAFGPRESLFIAFPGLRQVVLLLVQHRQGRHHRQGRRVVCPQTQLVPVSCLLEQRLRLYIVLVLLLRLGAHVSDLAGGVFNLFPTLHQVPLSGVGGVDLEVAPVASLEVVQCLHSHTWGERGERRIESVG